MTQSETFLDLSLEEVMSDRFGRYSKYIIQDRALPDVRDGLKPVQRRILYAMYKDRNTHDKNYRKAAKTVGTVIGNYHPHGDTSVYDAMVRLSQDWKMRNILIEMHGNNGSIDGDPPAAMRYTETRLSNIASELLREIEKDTVDFIPNFDDTSEEPTVLPAKFPNLLVNGSTGISAGYATDIPPHNLEEVIDAVIMKIDHPNASVEKLMTVIEGPDFPTGGIIQGIDGIKKAYETGKGKVIVRGKAEIVQIRGNREQIVIDEIPYDVNKANLVKRIDELRLDRKVEGIVEVRDETDRTGLRIVIELRKGANSEGILNYLYKHTDLQVTYHFNMVAIQDKTPKQLSLPQLLDAYIQHQKEVVTRQTSYELRKSKERAHIVEGLIKAVSILDELIAVIRASNNKQDAKSNIMKTFDFTEQQAEAIVTLQLYRLTNTDIVSLEEEAKELQKKITYYESILNSEKKLLQTIKKDLRRLKKLYKSARRTTIEKKIEKLKIDIEVTVPSEDTIVSVTRDGYIKRTSLRSYSASNGEDFPIKDEDHIVSLIEVNTTDDLLLFTNKGNYLYIPVHKIPDIRWKEIGQHVSNIVTLEEGDDEIVTSIPIREFNKGEFLIFITEQGMIKKSQLDLYKAQRYTRSLIALNLNDGDQVINVFKTDGNEDIFISTNVGYGLWFHESELTPIGVRARGVKSIDLKEGEKVISGQAFTPDQTPFLIAVTQRGACKRMTIDQFERTTRARRGVPMLRELKNKPHRIKGLYLVKESDVLKFTTTKGIERDIHPFELPISERQSNGSFIIDSDNDGEITDVWIKQTEPIPVFKDDKS